MVKNIRRWFTVSGLVLVMPILVFASGAEHGSDSIVHRMANLVLQLSIILFAARYSGILFKKLELGVLRAALFICLSFSVIKPVFNSAINCGSRESCAIIISPNSEISLLMFFNRRKRRR